ncbi:MAG: non-canonical purine NTP pyrophosphatase, RdgB/HAM1 family [Euryarchaeota archaeon RBG_19FT_COMBO_56_21]|nr:MAG: non-canonical purine NTP pyrophosphatase, RdgB/HAM1 family [Euryarchaeota archaeon RBG_19FT_COMBO_56_21]
MHEHGFELEHLKTTYPEIQADTLEETIAPGLRWLMERYHRPMMIDDSGLFIDALKGFPGVYSSYVFKTLGCDGILKLMADLNVRSARFECCIGFLAPGGEPEMVKAIAKGSISNEKIGTGGFGYDPIFVPARYDRTYAQLEIPEKNKISHRGLAIELIIKELSRLLR